MFVRYLIAIIILFHSAYSFSGQSFDDREWLSIYEHNLRDNKDNALSMLEERYNSLSPGAEKLYVSSLIYDFMNRYHQPYFGRLIKNQPEYSEMEQSYVHALNDESNGDFIKASEHYLSLLDIMKKKNDINGKMIFEYHLCKVLNHQAQYYKANYYCSALQTHVNDNSKSILPLHLALRVIANNQFFRGEHNNALAAYLHLLEVFPNHGDISAIYNDIGNLLKVIGRFQQSETYLLQALNLRLKSSNSMKLAQVQHSLASLYLEKKQFDLSLKYFKSALTILKSESNSYGLGLTYIGIGDAYIGKGNHQLGDSYLTKGLEFAEDLENQKMKAKIYLALAESYYQRTLYIPASNYAKNALSISKLIHDSQYQSSSLFILSKIYAASNSYKTAYEYYQTYSNIELANRDIDNRKAIEALDLTKTNFEQEYKRSELFNLNRYQALQIETMQRQNVAYNFIVFSLFIIILIFIYLNRKTKRNAQVDSLTGILNRAASISNIKAQPHNNNSEFNSILILLDLDNFKSINDGHGHPTGDLALKHVTNTISSKLGKYDIFGRLGGEEFIILLRDVDELDVKYRVESLHQAISMKSFISESNQTLKITASFSYLATSKSLHDFDDLYSILDQALYQAKQNGRDCIIDAYNDPIDLPSAVYSSIHS
ncbi:GGDEF domain-containing protein [Vibrio cortegadensis]|uniref:diguanylate cyclase n=1 Tax=Vibrio cortegadensis TaxID=1328770 RepID=A0ABV4M5K4_9VIBR